MCIIKICEGHSFSKQKELNIYEFENFLKEIKEQNLILDDINIVYSKKSFLKYFEEEINQRQDITNSTKLSHKRILKILKEEFHELDYFDDLTPKNIKKLDNYLHTRRIDKSQTLMSQTTIYKYHSILKKYIKRAYRLDLCKNNPYDKIILTEGEYKEVESLTPTEIAKIYNYQTENEEEQLTKNLFILQCYTGLAYCDLYNCPFEELKSKRTFDIENKRQKTHTTYVINIQKFCYEILQKYNFKLPKISNSLYNYYLKKIAKNLNITKRVTSHIGRHLFCTINLDNNIPIHIVKEMMGHKRISTTEKYNQKNRKQILQAFDAMPVYF